jgi:hypothetical protein
VSHRSRLPARAARAARAARERARRRPHTNDARARARAPSAQGSCAAGAPLPPAGGQDRKQPSMAAQVLSLQPLLASHGDHRQLHDGRLRSNAPHSQSLGKKLFETLLGQQFLAQRMASAERWVSGWANQILCREYQPQTHTGVPEM